MTSRHSFEVERRAWFVRPYRGRLSSSFRRLLCSRESLRKTFEIEDCSLGQERAVFRKLDSCRHRRDVQQHKRERRERQASCTCRFFKARHCRGKYVGRSVRGGRTGGARSAVLDVVVVVEGICGRKPRLWRILQTRASRRRKIGNGWCSC